MENIDSFINFTPKRDEKYIANLINKNTFYAVRAEGRDLVCDVIEDNKKTKTLGKQETGYLIDSSVMSGITDAGVVSDEDDYTFVAVHYDNDEFNGPIVFDNFEKLQRHPEMIEVVHQLVNYQTSKRRQELRDKKKRVKREEKKEKLLIVGAGVSVALVLGGVIFGAFKTAKEKNPNWKPMDEIKTVMTDDHSNYSESADNYYEESIAPYENGSLDAGPSIRK